MESSFYFDGDFRKNPKTKIFCAICQRDLKHTEYYIYLGTDVCEIRHPKHLLGDELVVPIGSECCKLIPKEYVLKNNSDR